MSKVKQGPLSKPKLKAVPTPKDAKPQPPRNSAFDALVFSEFIVFINDKQQDAIDFKISYGQWQDILGRISNECGERARDASVIHTIRKPKKEES